MDRTLIWGETDAELRLRRAVCELSDFAWREHPDYRADHALNQALHLPFYGVDHRGRCFLALALHARYGGDAEEGIAKLPHGLIDPDSCDRAIVLGLALRLAYALTGGAPELLSHTRLELSKDRLTLKIEPKWRILAGDAVQRRLDALGKALERETAIAS